MTTPSPTNAAIVALNSTMATIIANATTTEEIIDPQPHADDTKPSDESLRFILVPLGVLISIMFLSAMVYLMSRNRNHLVSMYKKRQTPYYTLDASDLDDDDPNECLLSGKLHIDQRYDSYQSQNHTHSRELYT